MALNPYRLGSVAKDNKKSYGCFIGLLEGEVVSYTQCYSNGNPKYAGAILANYYEDKTKVMDLLSLGKLSILGPEIGQPQDIKDKHFGWCCSYGRDGESKFKSRKVEQTTVLGFISLCQSQECYGYLYDPTTDPFNPWWFYKPQPAGETIPTKLSPLTEADVDFVPTVEIVTLKRDDVFKQIIMDGLSSGFTTPQQWAIRALQLASEKEERVKVYQFMIDIYVAQKWCKPSDSLDIMKWLEPETYLFNTDEVDACINTI